MKKNRNYIIKSNDYLFIMTDILMFCRYCLQERKGKCKTRITISNLHKNLYHYDYGYKPLAYGKLKNVLIIMFPLYKNNHKHSRFFKISDLLVNYWGKKFGINYEFHKEIFVTFRTLEEEKYEK